MRIYLSALNSRPYLREASEGCHILESYCYIKPWLLETIPKWKSFMLDSGAFTYMSNKKKGEKIDWDEYTERYAEFVKNHKIKYFIELDIDSIAGLREVERLRNKLEGITGRQCIPVWHKSRGKEYFIDMCKSYKFVAIGGIASKKIKKTEHKYFPWFIDTAHEHGARIHGLGYTITDKFKDYRFDSVDSTSWIGSRFGFIYRYSGGRLIAERREKKRTAHFTQVDTHNFKVWALYQKIMDTEEWGDV